MIFRSWKLPWVSRPGIEKIPGLGAGRPCGQVLQKSPEYGRPTVLAAKIIGAALLVSLFALELKTSWLQSHVFSAIDRRLTYTMQPGPSRNAPYPPSGPHDIRLGYARLPVFLQRLTRNGYEIADQARSKTSFGRLASRIVYPPYQEKSQAGLEIVDRTNQPFFVARYPHLSYPVFDSIPPLIVSTLLFIENRQGLDERNRYHNPAVEWDRFGKALLDLGYSKLDPVHPVSGGSTLATQLEKIRHSPGGRTAGAIEKLRQMASASLRAYLNGERTLEARKQIICDYINSMPLATFPGYGEIDGLGDGLDAWFGADFATVNRLLREKESARNPELLAGQARAFRQVLTLLMALKKPSAFLTQDRRALDARVDGYLHLLAKEGIIDPALRDAVLQIPAGYRNIPLQAKPVPFWERKAADGIRVELLSLLGLDSVYDLDRLDLEARTTIDWNVQRDVTRILRQLDDPAYDSRAGLYGRWLLGTGDPESVIYSFTLFESTPAGNVLRVQADNFDQPFNINEGTKLELGSTAKLRTLVHYMEIVADLHKRYSPMSPGQLESVFVARQDHLTRWAVDYLSTARNKELPAMLAAAMSRKYFASPAERFFTGGGVHYFANFDREDNNRILTVSEAFRKSVNLVFIRLMRDIVNYEICRLPGVTPALIENRDDPQRRIYLSRFADREGSLFLSGFYEKYRGQTPDRMLLTLVGGLRKRSTTRLAVIYRSVRPQASPDLFAAFMRAYPAGAALTVKGIGGLYEKYGPDKFSLEDRGYLAGVHPLELWLLEYSHRNPVATLDEVLSAGVKERQEVYAWLFKTRHKSAQDNRIRTVLEADAFKEIHKAWKRLGFPFDYLVPSYATAIGSSGDNPAALARLMGILANDGVRRPTLRIRSLRFAAGTPFETIVKPRPAADERVLPSSLVAVVKQELIGVVKGGTARRISGAIALPDGTPVEVGGKTGTGDNRFERFAKGGAMIDSRVINRTAAFVFMIGDRFFGTVTAFVPGPKAAAYGFTSALPVQVLRNLAPTLMPLIAGSRPTGAADAPRPADRRSGPHQLGDQLRS
jgi:membrane peptidoglycan carboxypeptidase